VGEVPNVAASSCSGREKAQRRARSAANARGGLEERSGVIVSSAAREMNKKRG